MNTASPGPETILIEQAFQLPHAPLWAARRAQAQSQARGPRAVTDESDLIRRLGGGWFF
ncbi:hypothetical protein KBY93_07785 [Synechococcus sp. J7-Johnson]|uniref:hypothetical protein n=1 Tax=Synechococcus sp. J7-Johnson TaxID=2823737 RepID=UPI0028F451CF|nr:hypothetical protein [Synechococcus sp. J7-Johnson]MCP9840537.1 hypothetical protein [Synechococcus sp. J7-Johnson]